MVQMIRAVGKKRKERRRTGNSWVGVGGGLPCFTEGRSDSLWTKMTSEQRFEASRRAGRQVPGGQWAGPDAWKVAKQSQVAGDKWARGTRAGHETWERHRKERKITPPQDFRFSQRALAHCPAKKHTILLHFSQALPGCCEGRRQKQRVTRRAHSLQMEGDSSLDQYGCHGDERRLGSGYLLEEELARGLGRWDGKRRRHPGWLQGFLASAISSCY